MRKMVLMNKNTGSGKTKDHLNGMEEIGIADVADQRTDAFGNKNIGKRDDAYE